MSLELANKVMQGSRDLFPGLRFDVYANHASISPLSEPVCTAINEVMAAQAREGVAFFPAEVARRERLRGQLASLVGTEAEDIALVENTTAGVVAVAGSLPWRQGDRVLVFSGEFPTNITPWQQAARRHGLELVWMDADDFRRDRAAALEAFEQHLAQGVRLVAVSAVQFTTGQLMPLATMGYLCRRHGSEFFVDAIQAAGIVPLDVKTMDIDYLACGSHKWLMGPEGVGFVYIAPEKAETLEPNLAGWISHEDAFEFLTGGPETLRYDRPFQRGARMLESGTFNSIGCAGLEASLGLIQSIGVETIHAHVQTWLDVLESQLLERGFESARMPETENRSGILSVWPPDHRPAADWAADLAEEGISCASPAGWLRFAPHWPNAVEEVASVVQAVDRILAR
ncbi:selenocysteine lyase/cysteine desulfurase [Natronospira proteinivora]|uniref:Selenocysteine lyase/cysteine desulfurase n=1 Tax=Natronospira proteinivora TaxID=1807133 RepID=A0ABT1G6X9_9GAMM|nr:aminotransferase class V-fold PLP-dependent enzyme [Natronospira proteinivora]MCP1727040.1 selenocysteine lyase/cysteine desulfurase [Natronospira proteinivora]